MTEVDNILVPKKMVDGMRTDESLESSTVEVENQVKEEDPIDADEIAVSQNQNSFNFNKSIFLSVIVALIAIIGYFAGSKLIIKTSNYYIRSRYFPNESIRYFIENPMSDLKFNIPIYLEIDGYNFPDLTEAAMIQIHERKQNQYGVIPELEFVFEKGSFDERIETPSTNDSFFYRDAFYAKIHIVDKVAIFVDPVKGFGTLLSTSESVNSNDLPFFFTQMLVDHCFRDEFEKLSLDSFIKLTFSSTENKTSLMFRKDYDYDKEKRLENIKRVSMLSKSSVNIVFVMMGDYDWDISTAVDEYFNGYLDLIKDFVDIKMEFFSYQCDEEESVKELKLLGDDIPVELSDLKHFSNYYEACDSYVMNKGYENNTIRFIFYPYGNSEKIYEKVIDENPLYTESSNYEVALGDWGLIYFAHDGVKTLPEEERITRFESNGIKDALDSYFAQLLTILGVPAKNMAPKFRIQIFKRLQITRNFVNLSHLLFLINNKLHYDDEIIPSRVLDEILLAFEDREAAIQSCKIYDLDSCFYHSQRMIDHLFATDFL